MTVGKYTSAAPTLTDGEQRMPRLTSAGALVTDNGGAVAAQFPATLGQKTKAASFPVTLASDEDLLGRLGEVQASPTANTLLARLKALADVLPSSLGAKTAANSLSITPASDALFALTNAASLRAGMATYRATGTGYAAYATPTDMLVISGSATKTVAVTNLFMQIQSTSAALQTLYFVKRSTANTGGTASNPAAVPLDSAEDAATAALSLYSVIPDALGTSVGNVAIAVAASVALTGTPGTMQMNQGSGLQYGLLDLRRPIVLHGAAESLCINYNGAALTPGFSATWGAEWVEY
jgi:hypothetical protein